MAPSAARPLPRARGTCLIYRVPAKILRSKRFVGRGDAGVKSVAVAVRRSLAYAPCGDAVTPSVCFADISLLYRVPAKILRSKRFVGRGRGRQGEGGA